MDKPWTSKDREMRGPVVEDSEPGEEMVYNNLSRMLVQY